LVSFLGDQSFFRHLPQASPANFSRILHICFVEQKNIFSVDILSTTIGYYVV
jgi:hypothetical protein